MKPPFQIRIPGKFFLSGEYAALRGMPTLTVAVKPEFQFISDENKNFSFHPESPAGLWSSDKLSGSLIDPYQGWGGMGLSTAEFLFNYSLSQQNLKVDTLSAWKSYRKLLEGSSNIPSGVDLITQIEGGYVATQLNQEAVEKHSWGFSHLGWCLALTGNKLKTHEHLKSDLSQINWSEVEALSSEIHQSFSIKSETSFIEGLKHWREFLLKSGLETPLTTELIDQLRAKKNVILAKGCGALGSDAIWILYKRENQNSVTAGLKQIFNEKCYFIYDSDVATSGMTWENL